jgi:hypothetical protein
MVRSVVMFVGTVILLTTLPSDKPKAPEPNTDANIANAQPRDYKAQAKNSAASETTKLPSPEKSGPSGNSEQTAAADTEQESVSLQKGDLKAQQSMADSAKGSLKVAWIQLFGSLVGIVILVLTLIATVRATKAAQDSADAARQAISLERAYMTFDRTEEEGQLPEHKVQFIVFWRNTGRTPAILLRKSFMPKSATIPTGTDLSEQKLGPEQEVTCATETMTQAYLESTIKSGTPYCLCAHLIYKGIFDNRHESEVQMFQVTLRQGAKRISHSTHRNSSGGPAHFDLQPVSPESK